MNRSCRVLSSATPVVGCAMMFLLATCAVGRANPVLGQVDNFSGSSPDNWGTGHTPGQVIATGGPDGANSPYLDMSATGTGGAGSKMTLFNDSQWTGNYTTAGVGEIQMELKNLGASPLIMRIVLESGSGGSPGWASTIGFALPADSNWHLATFSLDTADLTAVNSPPTLSAVLSDVGELRLIESSAPAVEGDVVSADVGIGDITAVPEPADALTILASLPLLIRRRRPQ